MQKLCGFLSARSTYNSLSIIKIVTPDGLPQHQRVHEAFQIYQVPSRFEVIQPSAKVYILHFTLNYNSVTHEKCVPRLVRAYMYIKDQYTLLGLGLIYFHCVTGGGNKQYLLKTHFFLDFGRGRFDQNNQQLQMAKTAVVTVLEVQETSIRRT